MCNIAKFVWSPFEKQTGTGNVAGGIAGGIIGACMNAGKIVGRIVTVAGGTALTALAIKALAGSTLSAAAASNLTTIAIVGGAVSGAALALPIAVIAGISLVVLGKKAINKIAG